MAGVEHRADLAVRWLESNLQVDQAADAAGWGWVPDVPPNPQNTAEVVCALQHYQREIPRRGSVIKLIRADVVEHQTRGNWAFNALVDVAWRLRALRCLLADPATDRDVLSCVSALLEAQDETGGWRLAGPTGPVSITGTVAAITALWELETEQDIASAVRTGLTLLTELVLDRDERARQLYAQAQIARLLSRPGILELSGPRAIRARREAVGAVLDALARRETGIQYEVFRRGEHTDVWRHMTLQLSLQAVCAAAPERVFDPGFRRGFIQLLDLQERGEININQGGFRTSQEGFVTSYATTQALEVLAGVEAAVSERANPARVFDLMCVADGAHHTDPQLIVEVGRHKVMMNSEGALTAMLLAILSGGALAVLGVVLSDSLHHGGSGGLVILGTAVIGCGVFGFAAARLPSVSNRRIALAVFTAFTAVVVPAVTFLLA